VYIAPYKQHRRLREYVAKHVVGNISNFDDQAPLIDFVQTQTPSRYESVMYIDDIDYISCSDLMMFIRIL
jgi:hypothetical protein